MRVEVVERDGVEMRVDTCKVCGKPFEQPRRQGRPRQKCDVCNGTAAPTVVQPSQHRVESDPPVRTDGRCACGCGKRRKVSKEARRYAGVQLDLDPFASTECCKRFYGVEFGLTTDDEEVAEAKRRGFQKSAAMFRDRHPHSRPGVFAR